MIAFAVSPTVLALDVRKERVGYGCCERGGWSAFRGVRGRCRGEDGGGWLRKMTVCAMSGTAGKGAGANPMYARVRDLVKEHVVLSDVIGEKVGEGLTSARFFKRTAFCLFFVISRRKLPNLIMVRACRYMWKLCRCSFERWEHVRLVYVHSTTKKHHLLLFSMKTRHIIASGAVNEVV